jgi:hypothetical protein
MNDHDDTNALLARVAAMPLTHAVIATYDNGKVYRFETRSEKTAHNYAHPWFRKIGKSLISRETGETVRVVKVEIVGL